MVVLFEGAVLFATVHDRRKAQRQAEARAEAHLDDDVPSAVDPSPSGSSPAPSGPTRREPGMSGPRVDNDQLACVRPSRAGTTLTSDLRHAEWVTPTTMVAVAAQAHRAREAGESFVVRAPVRPDPASYAARMHLGAVLHGLGATHDLPAVAERDQRGNLVELTAIRTGADADRLAELVYHKLVRHDPELASALHRSIGEVGQNVPEHAAAVGYLAAQRMPRRNELLVAVADAGVGLLRTLAHRGAVDHAEAVALATEPAVSEFDGPTRGARPAHDPAADPAGEGQRLHRQWRRRRAPPSPRGAAPAL